MNQNPSRVSESVRFSVIAASDLMPLGTLARGREELIKGREARNILPRRIFRSPRERMNLRTPERIANETARDEFPDELMRRDKTMTPADADTIPDDFVARSLISRTYRR